MGVVLAEAMAAGCIVFASRLAWASRWLVKDDTDGFLFTTKKELKRKLLDYLNLTPKEVMAMRKEAIRTLADRWSGSVAAQRLHAFLLSRWEQTPFIPPEDGPLSLAIK